MQEDAWVLRPDHEQSHCGGGGGGDGGDQIEVAHSRAKHVPLRLSGR